MLSCSDLYQMSLDAAFLVDSVMLSPLGLFVSFIVFLSFVLSARKVLQ